MIQDDEAHIGLAFAPASTATLRSLYAFEQPLRAIVSRESPLAKKACADVNRSCQYTVGFAWPQIPR